jgi:hypothetical protein
MESPDEARQEAQAYERLLVGLTTGQICLPDEVARAAVETAATAYDEGSNHAEIARQSRCAAWPALRARRGEGLTLADFQMQRVVLALVLREYPILLTLPALASLALPDPRSLVGCVTLARAVRDLAREGLLLSNGLLILPSKPALHLNRYWG